MLARDAHALELEGLWPFARARNSSLIVTLHAPPRVASMHNGQTKAQVRAKTQRLSHDHEAPRAAHIARETRNRTSEALTVSDSVRCPSRALRNRTSKALTVSDSVRCPSRALRSSEGPRSLSPESPSSTPMRHGQSMMSDTPASVHLAGLAFVLSPAAKTYVGPRTCVW